MDTLTRLFRLLQHLPPVSPGRLLMPCVFLSGWTVLGALRVDPLAAFVWSAVLAQAAQVWAVMPLMAWHQRRLFGRAHGALTIAVAVALALFAAQILSASPVFTQRLLSLCCAAYALTLFAGLLGDRQIIERFAPVRDESTVPMVFRRHLLRLYTITAALVLVVNEALLVTAQPLGLRVTALALLPILLHYLFVIMLVLTCPPLRD